MPHVEEKLLKGLDQNSPSPPAIPTPPHTPPITLKVSGDSPTQVLPSGEDIPTIAIDNFSSPSSSDPDEMDIPKTPVSPVNAPSTGGMQRVTSRGSSSSGSSGPSKY